MNQEVERVAVSTARCLKQYFISRPGIGSGDL
jgi:hypothetical protein